MIGIDTDTDILLRLWLNDDPAQNMRIDVLLAAHGGMPGSLLVTDVVLAEAVRTLKAAFDQDKQAQLIAVRSLLEETAFAFEIAKPSRRHPVCSNRVPADSPTAWSSPSMLATLATVG